MRALVVDPVAASGEALAKLLQTARISVEQTGHGTEAIELARRQDFEVLVADFGLPDMDGCDLVRRLRAARIEMPVILLTEQGRPQTRIKAFGAGADDVVTKPYDPDELCARVQAIMRRDRGASQQLLHCGPVQLNVGAREAMVAGEPVRLTSKEYAILELLALRRGMVLTKEVFMNHLYGGLDEPEVKIIDVFVCKLRTKLAKAGAPNVIGTVWGRGYTVHDTASQLMPPPVAPCPLPRPIPVPTALA